MNEGQIYDRIHDLVNDAFAHWDTWTQHERAYTTLQTWRAYESLNDETMKRHAFSKIYTHQRLYTNILRMFGDYDDYGGGRNVLVQ